MYFYLQIKNEYSRGNLDIGL